MTTTAPHRGALPAGCPTEAVPLPARPFGGFAGRHRPPHQRLLALVTLLGTVLGLLLAGAAPASAHAALTGSNPRDGAVVASAPKEVTLTFSEQIAMGKDSIRVLEPSGKRADRSTVRDLSSESTVSYGVDLLPGLPEGTYTVAWQAVSADSHPISGAFTFSIGAPSKTEVSLSKEEPGGGLVGLLYDIARYTAYTGFLLMVGAASFVLLCWQRGAGVRPVQRLITHGWVTLTASTLVLLLLRSPYTGSGKLADAFELSGLKDVLETKTGAALVSRLLLLGAAALFIAVLFGAYARRDGEPDTNDGGGRTEAERKDLTFGLTVGGTVVAAGIAATWAMSEHASTGIQPGIAMPVDVIHLLAVATWLGGLAALLTALYRVPSIEETAVRRFSQVAFVSVVALAATGLYQSWRQVGSWSALTGTSYGQLLLVKVALVVAMVGVAWVSRRWTARLAQSDTADPARVSGTAGVSSTADTAGTVAVSTAETADRTDTAGTGATAGAADPERVAQLARQQAAVATASRKKVRDADPQRSGLRRSVLAEAAIAIVLLAVTTALTTTEPGRTQEEAAATTGSSAASGAAAQGPAELTIPFDTGGANGKGAIRLTLDPASPGANTLHLWVDGPNGTPLDAPEVKVSFTLRAKQIGPLPITPQRLAAGHWTAPSVQIPMPGDWQVQVTVRTSDFDQTTVDKNVKIG
ncbi:copper resistance protein CopC [Streptomyces albipurpureus]|uniref:Copper resistance protein CopC n=1 Tax=Streptomyces albipurpureus TaxID=2897419 RepID=A0ABT0US26_9ACTN|nr:copper resistance protein CopC [Streptomyces sp. CWNU-1]MCM2391423.1 copper resistance protein CopC [Streptomyces sp. CWNU-1]